MRDRVVAHVLRHRPRAVVVLHDTDELHSLSTVRRRVLDASGTREDERVVLEHGCLACTLREDVLPTLVRVAEVGQWDEVVLALPVPVLPEGVIHVLQWGVVGSAHVLEHVRLEGVTTVVDADSLCARLRSEDLLEDLGLAAADTDGRSVAELTACQVEQADTVAVLELEQADAGGGGTVDAMVAHLSPLAVRVALGPDGEGTEEIVSTGRGTPDARAERQSLTLLALEMAPDTHVATLVWRSEHPLHPVRLYEALDEVVGATQRGRGHLQLSNRPDQALVFESAGSHVSLGVLEEGALESRPSYELVLTGISLDVVALQHALDACVVTEAERTAGLPFEADPFLDALGEPAGRS